jgi:hypothetical protein
MSKKGGGLQALARNLIAQSEPIILHCPLGEARAALPQERGPRYCTAYPRRRRRHVASNRHCPRVRRLPWGRGAPSAQLPPRGTATHAANFSTWRPHPDASCTACEVSPIERRCLTYGSQLSWRRAASQSRSHTGSGGGTVVRRARNALSIITNKQFCLWV